jgi:hypothetical protein
MFSNTLKRPALGQIAALGTLYDARSDTFVPLSLLNSSPPAAAVDKTEKHSTDVKISKTDTYKEKFARMGVDAELSASFLAGLVNVGGSGQYLADRRESGSVMLASMHYSITTVQEDLNLPAKELKDCFAFSTLESNIATHVVTGISWGAHCVITAKQEITNFDDKTKIAGQLDAELGVLKMVGLNGKAELTKVDGEKSVGDSFEVTIYGDVLANDGLVPTDFESAHRFLSNVHKYIASANNGKGKPITYTLLPLSFLSIFRLVEIKGETIYRQLSLESLEKFVQLFDELRAAQQTVQDYYTRICKHSFCISPGHVQAIADQLNSARVAEAGLKSNYARVLKDVRAGRIDAQELWKLLETFRGGNSSPENLTHVTKYIKKMDFVDSVVAQGARYVGYEGNSLDTELAKNLYDDAFILFFNDEVRSNCDRWDQNYALLLELLRDTNEKKLVLVMDCDASGEPLEFSYISQTRIGKIITEDVLEQQKVMASNCIMRFKKHSINPGCMDKPVQRRAVKIPCPSPYCSRITRCNWICSVCHSVVEYGYTDEDLYCDCGACHFQQWEFRCKNPKHGSPWAQYDPSRLLQLLRALEPFEELNILILGETGVGKSTWINAFVNYLTFESLDQALNAENLEWVIPCSFATQFEDKSDLQGRLIQKDIKIGTKKGEGDGSGGKSATKWTSVYAVSIGNTRVRLIDTPGIGDTNGIEQDNKNMADILRVLRGYPKLHGILVLLKPNSPRLNTFFKFCIQQLLTHLHRSAANNLVFGFTNTRGSNYKPGDTFKPLQNLLEKYHELNMGLFRHNVYCFDSESFRYLAARKKGVDMGMVEDNSRSWEYSVEECKRLVTHFRGLTPHQVQSTINLNETRHIILRLAEPMSKITQAMQSSIAVNEDQIAELRNKEFSRDQLQSKLWCLKKSIKMVPVPEPRTVCTDTECTEVRSDVDTNFGVATVIYKTMCHKPCYLNGVDLNVRGHSLLQHCAVMDEGGICTGCRHPWGMHMHVLWDYGGTTTKCKDEAVDRDLGDNASARQLQKAAIRIREDAIEQFKFEHQQFQESAIQFGFFLKRHSIIPYNDATLEYLDHQIDEEKKKVQAGGDTYKDATLKAMQKYRAEHVEKVRILDLAMKRGEDDKFIGDSQIPQQLESLYALPQYGSDFRKLMEQTEKAAQATNRERSYNVRAGDHWNKSGSSKLGEEDWEELGQTATMHSPRRPPPTGSTSKLPGRSNVIPTQGNAIVARATAMVSRLIGSA